LREDRLVRPSEEETIGKASSTLALTPGPESGLDCLICATFTRYRVNVARIRQSGPDSGQGESPQMVSSVACSLGSSVDSGIICD